MESRSIAPPQVMRGSSWFLLAVAVTAAGGFVAWAIAARLQAPEVVGAASLLFALVMFVNYLTGMGLPVAVARFGHGSPDAVEPLWSWALVYTTAASALGTAGFVLVAPGLLGSDRVEPVMSLGWPWAALLFFVVVNGISLAALAEMRFVAMRAWGALLLRVVGFTVLRLPLLFIPAVAAKPLGLFLIVAGPPALSGWLAVGALALRPVARRWGNLRPRPGGLADAWRFATVNWLGTLAAQAPQFTMPLIVATAVTVDVNAAFYLAWSITMVVFLVPHTISQVVLSEASRLGGVSNHPFRVGLVLSVVVMVAAALGAWAFGGLATTVFGPDYQVTTDLLVALCAAGIPWAITSISLARVRALGASVATVVITVGFALFTLVPAAVLTRSVGVNGAATGWLVGNVAAALLAIVVTRIAVAGAAGPSGGRAVDGGQGFGVAGPGPVAVAEVEALR
jgi:O-antigen/teichoic acid export membrane protein